MKEVGNLIGNQIWWVNYCYTENALASVKGEVRHFGHSGPGRAFMPCCTLYVAKSNLCWALGANYRGHLVQSFSRRAPGANYRGHLILLRSRFFFLVLHPTPVDRTRPWLIFPFFTLMKNATKENESSDV